MTRMKFFVMLVLLYFLQTWAQTDPIAEFRTAYQNQEYIRSFDILARLKKVSTKPAVFGKLMGVAAYRLDAYLYAMYLLEVYYQKIQKSPVVLANLVASARQLSLESYVAQTH